MKPILVIMNGVLRLDDHPALDAAHKANAPVVPVYIHEDYSTGVHCLDGVRRLGAARCWWLHQSLEVLSQSLEKIGSRLIVRRGELAIELARLLGEIGADAVFHTRSYDPTSANKETVIRDICRELGIVDHIVSGNLLLEPEMVRTKMGGAYSVFTPFWRTVQAQIDDTLPIDAPTYLRAPNEWPSSDPIDCLSLVFDGDMWTKTIGNCWQPGEQKALEVLNIFQEQIVCNYHLARDFPGQEATSRLSPYLAAGEISARRIWYELRSVVARNPQAAEGAGIFLKELGWREFSYHLLFHHPDLPENPLQAKFVHFPWRSGADDKLQAWQEGRTGFPIIDAGMRQLRQTGWMHNRVRMIVASFLVKDMLWHWRDGEAWFWDTLVDADLASNVANWQWVAGCGADAAPYFRIFNPVVQGQKFDPDGVYVKRWLPELSKLPRKFIHCPQKAPSEVLQLAGIELGKNYPLPILDRSAARERALTAFASIKNSV